MLKVPIFRCWSWEYSKEGSLVAELHNRGSFVTELLKSGDIWLEIGTLVRLKKGGLSGVYLFRDL